MASKDEKKIYGIEDAATGIPPSDEDFSLEEILTEYGGGLERLLLKDAEPDAAEEPSSVPEEASSVEDASPAEASAAAGPEEPSGSEAPETAGPDAPPEEPALPADDPPEEPVSTVDPEMLEEGLAHPVSLEEVVGSTVDAVLEEKPEPPPPPKRRLFSRRRKPEERPRRQEPEPEEEPIGPEPDLYEAALDCRGALRQHRGLLTPALIFALFPTLLLLFERSGRIIPVWTEDIRKQTIILLAFLAAMLVLCRPVLEKGVRMLIRGRCTGELLVSLSALASMADCVCRLNQPDRTPAPPYAAVSCLGLALALWGLTRESQGMYATFQTAALDDTPPYLVTETGAGACKQRGSLPGFYTAAMRADGAAMWQAALLPLILSGSMVFAGLSSLGQGRAADFFLNWSALLAAGGTYSLPLCWGLPFSRLTAHLQKAGCAVAGWTGAVRIGRGRYMVLTDADLFPPGTVQMNGVKVYGEELQKAASYAASMAQAAGSGLERVFDGYLRGELGHYELVDDFGFYEEGGWAGLIHGESVLMGTDAFLQKMDVRLPGSAHAKTAMYLAIDKQLAAVFALKYHAADNVEFALQMMQRGHVIPILASRDPNITPSLLKRMFHRGLRVEFPRLTERVALSEAERDRGRPRALIFREGLLPYAEAVVGSRRLCTAVRRSVLLSLFGSAVGLLLAYYLVGLGQYGLLHPLALEAFLLLWTLPVLLISDWAGRY